MTTSPTPRRLRRAVAAAIAAGATAAAALFGALPASAAPLVDPDALGSLTVHKFEMPEDFADLESGDGTEIDTTGLEPLAGVTFSARAVEGIDLSTNDGWADAAALSGAFDVADPEGSITGAGYTLAVGDSGVTDATGDVLFDDLPVGLYLVEETSYPAGVTPSAPFLITIPLTSPDSSDTWLYDVHAYPKNSVTGADKTVTDAGAVEVGDPVTFTISSDVPNETVIDGYRIVDPLDSRLDYVSTTVSLENGVALTEITDYTIAFDAVTNTVTVDFTDAGLTILEANTATRVVVEIDTTVNTIGEIGNTAYVYPNAGSFDIDPGDPGGPTPTPEVETRWGGVTLQKVDSAGTGLAGAVFAVYTSEADALNQTDPVTVDGDTEFQVAADGTLTLDGLRYSDFANGATVAPGDAGYITYYLVELQAPDGYELLAEPIEFLVDAGTTAVGVDLEVVNVPSNAGFELPLTGGTGTGLLYLLGGTLFAGGVIALLVTRAQRQRA